MERNEKRRDVIVVGGGLTGLSAAAYLGRAGLSVTVVEKASELGGRAATDVESGFSLNRGPHALYRRGEALAVLEELRVPFSAAPPSLAGLALHGGTLERLPIGAGTLLSTGLLGFAAKAEAGKWLAQVPRLEAARYRTATVREWLGEASPEVRELLEAFVRLSTYSNAPELMSAETAILQLQKAPHGVLYVDGGWQALVLGLGDRARSAGVEIFTEARAAELRPCDGAWTVSLADGRELGARSVVVTIPPSATRALLAAAGAELPAAPSPPVRLSALDVALSHLPRDDRRFVLGIDRPLYLSVHSAAAKLAPDGGAVVHVGKYLSPSDADPTLDRKELEGLLDLAQPGWREAVVHARFLPHMNAAERLDLASDGGAAGRPEAEVPGAPGLFLSGDWVKGGSWIADAALGGARRTAELVAARLSSRRAVA